MNRDAACEVQVVHKDLVSRVRPLLKDMRGVSAIFKVLADDTRLKILAVLLEAGEACVCDVAELTESSVATASHHLRHLRESKLAKSEKRGRQVFYSLADHHIEMMIQMAIEHAEEEGGLADGFGSETV